MLKLATPFDGIDGNIFEVFFTSRSWLITAMWSIGEERHGQDDADGYQDGYILVDTTPQPNTELCVTDYPTSIILEAQTMTAMAYRTDDCARRRRKQNRIVP